MLVIVIILFLLYLSLNKPDTGRRNKAEIDISPEIVAAIVIGAPRLIAYFEINGVTICETDWFKVLNIKTSIYVLFQSRV